MRFSSPCFYHYEQSGQGEHSVKSYKGIKRTHYNESFVFKAFVGYFIKIQRGVIKHIYKIVCLQSDF